MPIAINLHPKVRFNPKLRQTIVHHKNKTFKHYIRQLNHILLYEYNIFYFKFVLNPKV